VPFPTVSRHCARCRSQRRFRCTGKFRVNANRKFIDVWLLYDCARCGDTAKLPVLERVPVSRVDGSRLRAFLANDTAEAAVVARDRALLRRAGFSVGRRERG
jgi:hypothetical protein